MTHQTIVRHVGWYVCVFVAWFAVATVVSAQVPGDLIHPVPKPRPEIAAACQATPQASRDNVHIFLVNGLDPVHVCNFHGLIEHIHDLGFANVNFGQMWDGPAFIEQIREIRQIDPQARIALVGYSAGANVVWRATQSLNSDGTKVDLLVYVAGDTLRNVASARPVNATKVINVRAWGLVFLAGGVINGADIDQCDNYNLGLVRHSCVPSNPQLLEILGREFALLAELSRSTSSTRSPAPVLNLNRP